VQDFIPVSKGTWGNKKIISRNNFLSVCEFFILFSSGLSARSPGPRGVQGQQGVHDELAEEGVQALHNAGNKRVGGHQFNKTKKSNLFIHKINKSKNYLEDGQSLIFHANGLKLVANPTIVSYNAAKDLHQ
jgi:hypothetical protein